MNNIDIANGIVFQKMAVSKDSFEDRIICQKKVYLLQSLGTDLGYTYNWYVRGPYSPSLTNYIYGNLDVLMSNDFSKYNLNKAVEDNIDKVNSISDDIRNDFDLSSWYELLASLLFIYNNKESWKIKSEKSSLYKALMEQKPQFSEEQCEYAFGKLQAKGFISVDNEENKHVCKGS